MEYTKLLNLVLEGGLGFEVTKKSSNDDSPVTFNRDFWRKHSAIVQPMAERSKLVCRIGETINDLIVKRG